ncbi:MAG: DegT/DnrJ/EryC1/StrS family aminotransferase [Patescibacteria group bacterium]|nr:DegT/DnrJ/EryC1/StrS family aminotransferase [Patescibacteria group bacterium]
MKFLDLKPQYESIKSEIDNAIKKVLDSSIFIGGPEVESFEKEIANYCGTKFAIGLNSGTDALYLSLKALGIGFGDEVITTPFTFIATVEVIASCGANPVFVDIDPKTFNIDAKKIEEKITKKTKAIIPVHIFGQMANMDEVMKIAKNNNLYVIEDVAQAIGSEVKGKMAGSFGDFGCFSFFPSKNLGAYGDGGMIVTNNEEIADKVKLLRNHGSSPNEKYLNLVLGGNSRLDSIQAAILRVKLKYLNEWNQKRKEKADYYTSKLGELDESIICPFIEEGYSHVFHQYTIRVENGKRDKLKLFLVENGVPVMVYYSIPLHLQPVMKYLGYKKGDFFEAEKASEEVMSLPIYPELKKEEQDFIFDKIEEFYEQGR